jgi:hypothetical protein
MLRRRFWRIDQVWLHRRAVVDAKRRSALFGAVGLVAVIAAPEVLARRRAGFRMRGLPNGARYKGPVLTRDQLRQCVAEQRAINASEAELDRLQASLAKSEAAINRLEAQINAQEPLVDRYSQASVDSFNALIARHKHLVATHNTKLPSANARVEQVNAAVARFNEKCAEHVYYERDMQAVLAGK